MSQLLIDKIYLSVQYSMQCETQFGNRSTDWIFFAMAGRSKHLLNQTKGSSLLITTLINYLYKLFVKHF